MAAQKKKNRWIKPVIVLVLLLCAGGAAVRFLPFPWYVRQELPIVYFQSTDDASYETGVVEVRGWMLCYLVKPDTFSGTIETFMSDATYSHGEYKAKLKVTFDQEPKPDAKLQKGYRTMHIDEVDCEGDIQTFVDYWMDENRSPVIHGRFEEILLQRTWHRDGGLSIFRYMAAPGTTAFAGQKVVTDILSSNPEYPALPVG